MKTGKGYVVKNKSTGATYLIKKKPAVKRTPGTRIVRTFKTYG